MKKTDALWNPHTLPPIMYLRGETRYFLRIMRGLPTSPERRWIAAAVILGQPFA